MKSTLMAVSAVALSATAASAGGLERTTQSIGIIFEGGNYAELSFGTVNPKVSGVGAGTVANGAQPTPGVLSGDMAGNYSQVALGFKMAVNSSLDLGLILDSPFGADVNYPLTGYFAQGSTAKVDSTAVTAVARYKLPSNVSLIGGLRYQTLSASASIPFISSYTIAAKQDSGLGYLVGIAYEKPEIALRVALTYNSKIKHELATLENGVTPSTTVVETPQSVNLEAQTGIAKDTLLFGSVRWVNWSSFSVDPASYPPPTPLISYVNDTTSYTLGVGRRFNENWSAAISVGYEAASGGFASNLGPTDGRRSVTLGATYTQDKMKISAGVSYVDIGDAQTTLAANLPAGTFAKNHAIGMGMKVGFSF